jgi:tetratricopeptide (TPR) repeat protein
MPTLRFRHVVTDRPATHSVEIELEGDAVKMSAHSEFEFGLSAVDHERIRWYLEDLPQYPSDPGPAVAQQVREWMERLGKELFQRIFAQNPSADAIAQQLRSGGTGLRVEVHTSEEAPHEIPWELLRDPQRNLPLALVAKSFVRHPGNTAIRKQPDRSIRPLRILLVISRPGGPSDVPFRTIANELLQLRKGTDRTLQLDVLRPPRLSRLQQVLELAVDRGEPYDIVHFDGHGTYGPKDMGEEPRGLLIFEADTESGTELVSSVELIPLLTRAGLPVLILNACKSAYALPAQQPNPAQAEGAAGRARVLAYESLATAMARAGVPGIVAMSYNIGVASAARFVGSLYTSLLTGASLGEAVGAGRRAMCPAERPVGPGQPPYLQDWVVPLAYEEQPLQLFNMPPSADPVAAGRSVLTPGDETPAAELAIGRDEALLDLDRAFDESSLVLLHGELGGGKTVTSEEFGRWFSWTGGLRTEKHAGVVLTSSLEDPISLGTLLAQVADQVARAQGQTGMPWSQLSLSERRASVLQFVSEHPTLWLWDGVEGLGETTRDGDGQWRHEDRAALREFLGSLASTRAKVLLTSRREEREWLDESWHRVRLSPMTLRESVELARHLQRRYAPRDLVIDWVPIARYAGGNPLTLRALAQLLIKRASSRDSDVAAFLSGVQTGAVGLERLSDDPLGSTAPLAAAFQHAISAYFTPAERRQLSVLQLFERHVSADAFVSMGASNLGGPAPQLAGVPDTKLRALLARAADVGLLERFVEGWYKLHPAFPPFLARADRAVAAQTAKERSGAKHAFMRATAALGHQLASGFEQGSIPTIAPLVLEERNLLRARAIARQAQEHAWAAAAMVALFRLYRSTARMEELKSLVDDMSEDVTDPRTRRAKPGLVEEWKLNLQHRVQLARLANSFHEAESLQRDLVRIAEQSLARVGLSGDLATRPLTPSDIPLLTALAEHERMLGTVLFELHDPDCVRHVERALWISDALGLQTRAAAAELELGNFFIRFGKFDDLDRAERHLRNGITRLAGTHAVLTAQLTSALGQTYEGRLHEALSSGTPPTRDASQYLNTAVSLHRDALMQLPREQLLERAKVHNQLGSLFAISEEYSRAVNQFSRALRLHEQMGNIEGAGNVRMNIALALERAGRPEDAVPYAQAAIVDYRYLGAAGEQRTADATDLVSRLSSRCDPNPA